MADIDNNTVLKLNKDVIKRFEHNLKDGTMILCNMKTFEFWFGNEESRDLIKLINGVNTIQEIYSTLLSEYDPDSYEEVITAYNNVLEDLLVKNFIEVTA